MERKKEMREKLNKYILNEGVKATHVANVLGISKQHLNNYLKGRDNVSKEVEKKVSDFLKSKGYL